VEKDDAGGFRLKGRVALDAQNLNDWSAHVYDASLTVQDAQLDSVAMQFPQPGNKSANRRGSSDLPENGISFSGIGDLNATVRLRTQNNQQVLSIEHLSGKGISRSGKGGGNLNLNGTVTLDPQFYTAKGWTKNNYQLTLTADHFELEALNVVENNVSRLFRGELNTAPYVTWSGQAVSGALVLSDAELRGVPTFPVAGKSQELPPFPQFDRLKLGIGRNVRVNAPRLRALITGSGRVSETERQEGLPNVAAMVTGAPQNLNLTGSVRASTGGEIRFPSAAMRILNARVDFALLRDVEAQEWKPRVTVDAVARGRVDEFDVTLNITGPLLVGDEITEPQLSATSTPPGLSETQILARLAGTSATERGIVPEKEVGSEFRKQLVSLVQVSPYFESFLSGIEETLYSVFGIEIFSLEYRMGEPTAVRLGKELGRDFFFTYRRNVSGSTQIHSLRLDYRLKGNILLGFETDERHQQQLTLDWTFRFK
jgi:hypothetical protein